MQLALISTVFLGYIIGYILSIIAVEELRELKTIIDAASRILLIASIIIAAILLFYGKGIFAYIALTFIAAWAVFNILYKHKNIVEISNRMALVIAISSIMLLNDSSWLLIQSSILFMHTVLSSTLFSGRYFQQNSIRLYTQLNNKKSYVLLKKIVINYIPEIITVITFMVLARLGGVV